MEEIKQKLNSGNVFLQSQAVSSLNKQILQIEGDAVYESEEMKMLWNTANTSDLGVATLAVESLIKLVAEGCLSPPATLQNFIADLGCARSPTALVRGVTQLILLSCEVEGKGGESWFKLGTSSKCSHPYVLMVKRRPELTEPIMEEVHYLLFNSTPLARDVLRSLVEPLVYFSFCLSEETPPTAAPLLQILVAAAPLHGTPLLELLCKAASLVKVQSKSHFERKILLIRGLAQIAQKDQNMRLCAALLPCIVLALPHALKHGFPTRSLETYMINLAAQLGQGCDVTVCALAEAIPLTSGQLQVTLLRVGATLLSHRDGNPLVGGRLLPSLLQVLSASCGSVEGLQPAAAALVSLVQALPPAPARNTQLAGNEYWDSLSMTIPDLSTFVPAVALSDYIVRDPLRATRWLKDLAATAHQVSNFHYKVVLSVMLHQGSNPETVQESIKVLEREVKKRNSLACEIFPIVLYRLGREKDPNTRLQLLYLLPLLSVNKLCVPMVLKTLLALWTSPSLKPLVLRLMLEVWKVEPRTYSYLSQLINDKSFSSQDLEVSRAYVVSEICRIKPFQHGEELLSLLSGFLNERRGKEGTPQVVIALDGITALCEAMVIDLRTTWKVIAPKLVRDKRAEVIVRLCRLLSLTSKLNVKSKEFEDFATGVSSILWSWAGTKGKASVNEAAMKALEAFDPEHFALKMLPTFAREGHKLPERMASTPFEAARKAEDVLTFVPGLAWVKLAVGTSKNHAGYVESFLKALVEREVAGLPRGIYTTAIQEAKRKGCVRSGGSQPEPASYTFLPETSALRAFVVFLQDVSKLLSEATNQEEREKLLQGTTIILDALGQALDRPFPALDWSFLNEVLKAGVEWDSSSPGNNWAQKVRHGVFRVTAQQCNKSSSALNLISKWLIPSSSLLTLDDQLALFSLLDQLGRGLNSPMLQDFLSSVFSEASKDPTHLTKLLNTLKPHLTCDYVHDLNRNVMSNAVESLSATIEPGNVPLYDAFKACVADLPLKHIERLTSPSLWWEITDEKLYRAAVLRCHVAAKDPGKSALPWLNDLVDSAASLPGDRSHFLLVIAEVLVARSGAEESSAWLLSLLGRVRELLKKDVGENFVAVHEHQQRLTFYCDLLVLGLLVWSGVWATRSLEDLTSSHLTRDSLLTTAIVSLNGRIDWTPALPQLLNWFLSCFNLLQPHVGSRYQLKPPALLLAALSPTLSQAMWNKVVTMVM